MTDDAPGFAVDALEKAIQGRNAGAAAATTRRGGGSSELSVADAASAFNLPAMNFKFNSPTFLSRRARWLLSLGLLVVSGIALLTAYALVTQTPASAGAEWVLPPVMSLLVALFALLFAYAVVMGFGNVELTTTIGESGGEGAASATGFLVSGTVPPDKAKTIGRDAEVEAMFSEAVDATSLSDVTFILAKSADGEVTSGTVSVDEDGVTGRLKPASTLEASTEYQVTIAASVKSQAGKRLGSDKTWTFSTGV